MQLREYRTGIKYDNHMRIRKRTRIVARACACAPADGNKSNAAMDARAQRALDSRWKLSQGWSRRADRARDKWQVEGKSCPAKGSNRLATALRWPLPFNDCDPRGRGSRRAKQATRRRPSFTVPLLFTSPLCILSRYEISPPRIVAHTGSASALSPFYFSL